MVYNSQDTTRTAGGLAHAIATFFESVGLLNKGSADARAVPDDAEAATIQPITSNSLNVTRVGGLAALVASIGAVALAIFNVNKKSDPASIVMAAYLGAGAIVVAALLTAAIIVSADIRARTSVAVAHSPDTQTPIAPPPATVAQNHQPTTSPTPGTSIPPAVLVPPSPIPSPVPPSPIPSPVPPAAGTQASAGPSVTDHATATAQPWALYAIDNWDWPTARLLTATLDLWKVPYDHRDHRLAVDASFAPLIDSLVRNFSLPAPVRLSP